MLWKKRRENVQARAEALADDAVKTATDLAEKSIVIGPAGVLLLLGAAAVGAAATYYVAKGRKTKKPPE